MGRRWFGKSRHVLLLVAGVAALVGLVATVLAIHRDYALTIEDAKQRNVVLAQLLEEHARRAFDLSKAAIFEVSYGLDGDGPPTVSPGVELQMRRWIRNIPNISSFWVLDAQGQAIFTTQDLNVTGVSLADRQYFQAHRDGEEDLYIGGMTLGRLDGRWFFSLSKRLVDGEGNFRGVLLASMRTEYFGELYSRLGLAARHNMAIYKPDGTVIARRLTNWTGTEPPSGAGHPVFTTYYPQSPTGTYEAVSPIDGLTRIGAYRAVQGWPLIVTSVSERDDLMAAWWTRTVEIGAYGSLVLLGLAALTAWGMGRARADEDSRRQLELMNERLEHETRIAQQAMREAKLADRAKTQFLATMSHELRTPLNAIIGFSDGILNNAFGPTDSARVNGYIRDIHGAGLHLLSLINDVLDISAIEAGALTLHPERLETASLCDSVTRLIRPRAEAKSLRLDVDCCGGPEWLYVDERRIKQALLNLLSNAVKFTPDCGALRLTVSDGADGGIDLAVSDTGIGMDAEGVRTAMTLFGQVDNDLSRRHEGSGLGLPLTANLVELHGGRLSIASTPGSGTIATIHLPADCVVQYQPQKIV